MNAKKYKDEKITNTNRLQFYPLNDLTPLFHTGSLRLFAFVTAIFMLSELIPMNNETQTSDESMNDGDDGLKRSVG